MGRILMYLNFINGSYQFWPGGLSEVDPQILGRILTSVARWYTTHQPFVLAQLRVVTSGLQTRLCCHAFCFFDTRRVSVGWFPHLTAFLRSQLTHPCVNHQVSKLWSSTTAIWNLGNCSSSSWKLPSWFIKKLLIFLQERCATIGLLFSRVALASLFLFDHESCVLHFLSFFYLCLFSCLCLSCPRYFFSLYSFIYFLLFVIGFVSFFTWLLVSGIDSPMGLRVFEDLLNATRV